MKDLIKAREIGKLPACLHQIDRGLLFRIIPPDIIVKPERCAQAVPVGIGMPEDADRLRLLKHAEKFLLHDSSSSS